MTNEGQVDNMVSLRATWGFKSIKYRIDYDIETNTVLGQVRVECFDGKVYNESFHCHNETKETFLQKVWDRVDVIYREREIDEELNRTAQRMRELHDSYPKREKEPKPKTFIDKVLNFLF